MPAVGHFRVGVDGTGLKEIAPDEILQSWDLDSSFSAEERVAFDLAVHRGRMSTPHALGPWFNVSIVWEQQGAK